MSKQFVSYRRVSTDEQEESGLGLTAQKKTINSWITGNNGTLIKDFVETASGGKDDRPVLKQAVELAKEHRAKLIVAKQDRLSRGLGLIIQLRKDGVSFVDVSNPAGGEFLQDILGAVAAEERRKIGERTKDALDVIRASTDKKARRKNKKLNQALKKMEAHIKAKRWGQAKRIAKTLRDKHDIKLLGNKHPAIAEAQDKRLAGLKRVNREGKTKTITKAQVFAESLRPLLASHVSDGKNINDLVDVLNNTGIKTRENGHQWHRTQVVRLLKRLELKTVKK